VSSGLESLIVSVGDRAAEEAVARWRDDPAGAALLEQAPALMRWRATRTRRPARDGRSPFDDDDFPFDAPWPAPGAARPDEPGIPGPVTLGRSSPDLARRAAQAVSSWHDHVIRLVQAENVAKRSVARVASFDDEPLALVVIIGLLGHAAGHAAAGGGPGAAAQELLGSLLGPGPRREIAAKARAGLRERVRLLFDEEMPRFTELIEAAGVPDEAAPAQLCQAMDALEAAR
jgi:hypothetical protein